jgi:hypothetical protein
MNKIITNISYDTDLLDTFGVSGIVNYSDGSTRNLSSVDQVQEVMAQYQEQLVESLTPKTLTTDVYLHGSKESNWETADELGLPEKARSVFAYSCYEVTVTVNIDRKTGKAVATHLNKVPLVRPVEV